MVTDCQTEKLLLQLLGSEASLFLENLLESRWPKPMLALVQVHMSNQNIAQQEFVLTIYTLFVGPREYIL